MQRVNAYVDLPALAEQSKKSEPEVIKSLLFRKNTISPTIKQQSPPVEASSQRTALKIND